MRHLRQNITLAAGLVAVSLVAGRQAGTSQPTQAQPPKITVYKSPT